jgi:ABC-type transporter Mla MlaB component
VTTDMFRLTSRTLDPPLVLLELDGELDVTAAQAFTEAVTDAAGRAPLVLDLTNLSYIDSAGFAALDRLLGDRRIAIVFAPHGTARGAAVLVGLPFHDTVDAAVAALR